MTAYEGKIDVIPDLTAKIAIVIVTYNRPEYLKTLLESIELSTVIPDVVVVIDNASDVSTRAAVEAKRTALHKCTLVYRRLETNQGGSGGFSEGVKTALAYDCDWLWLMDDDVEVLPDGLSALTAWSKRFKCIHGRRYDSRGRPFSWQPRFSNWLGLPLPYVGNPFAKHPYFLTNCGCFEGMFVHSSIVARIGLPDPRFFITWDDAIYGWLASRTTDVAYVDHYVLRKTRTQRQISLGIRHLNDASNLSRFHVMKNRAYVELYFNSHGVSHSVGFKIGTILTFLKEILRLVAVEKSLSGLKFLLDGMREAKKLKRDKNWRPMPPL